MSILQNDEDYNLQNPSSLIVWTSLIDSFCSETVNMYTANKQCLGLSTLLSTHFHVKLNLRE